VFPNPSSSTININNSEKSDIEITDMIGKIIYKKKAASGQINVDISMIPRGIYYVKAKMQKRIVVKKILNDKVCFLITNLSL
jgi:hypothetical protein